MAVQDATVENGCLWAIKGNHGSVPSGARAADRPFVCISSRLSLTAAKICSRDEAPDS
jgi:hypothetical protein